VPRLFDHEFAYIFQNPDRRIIFAIPYESDFTLIGTTDLEYHGDPAQVAIGDDETRYLCEMAGRYFRRPVTPGDVVGSYSGVRPLLDDESTDPSSVTRDYSLELETTGAPLLSVFGGKITTFRRLAEEALDRLAPALGVSKGPWTRGVPLPGGDMPGADFLRFEASVALRCPWLPAPLRHRYARAYGTRITRLLGAATSLAGLGAELAPGLHEAEVDYLRRHEFARTSQDILWRRSKLALHLPPGATADLDAWIASHPA
jgi:glycerol-3-phosphate dehydrogenase